MDGYKVTIEYASRELSKMEKIAYKDTTDCVSLVDACEEDTLHIVVTDWVFLHIVNPHSKKQHEYDKFVLLAEDGIHYITGSSAFMDTFMDIWTEYQDGPEESLPVPLAVYVKPSKNNPQGFLTCKLDIDNPF